MENLKREPGLSNEEQLAVYDKMLTILSHQDWREFYFFFSEYRNKFQNEMNTASSWEEYLAARVCKSFVESVLVPMPDIIKHAKEEIEKEIADKLLDDIAEAEEEPGA